MRLLIDLLLTVLWAIGVYTSWDTEVWWIFWLQLFVWPVGSFHGLLIIWGLA